MSYITVLTHSQIPTETWAPLVLGVAAPALGIHGVEGVRILGDGVPSARTFVNAPQRQNSGLTFEVVETDWSAKSPWIARNERLLDGCEFVTVLGEVATRSAAEVLSRAFDTPEIHVLQVLEDGSARRVGRKNVKLAHVANPDTMEKIRKAIGGEAQKPKPKTEGEAAAWAKLMAPAPASKTKK